MHSLHPGRTLPTLAHCQWTALAAALRLHARHAWLVRFGGHIASDGVGSLRHAAATVPAAVLAPRMAP